MGLGGYCIWCEWFVRLGCYVFVNIFFVLGCWSVVLVSDVWSVGVEICGRVVGLVVGVFFRIVLFLD